MVASYLLFLFVMAILIPYVMAMGYSFCFAARGLAWYGVLIAMANKILIAAFFIVTNNGLCFERG